MSQRKRLTTRARELAECAERLYLAGGCDSEIRRALRHNVLLITAADDTEALGHAMSRGVESGWRLAAMIAVACQAMDECPQLEGAA